MGGLEEGVRGRQTDAKALIIVAAQEDGPGIGWIRVRRILDASAESLMPFVRDSSEPGSGAPSTPIIRRPTGAPIPKPPSATVSDNGRWIGNAASPRL